MTATRTCCKTTIDELPALFEVSTVYALLAWLGEPLLVNSPFGRGAVIALWLGLLAGLPLSRACARRLVLRRMPAERCLVLGDRTAAEQLAAKLAGSSLVAARVVGYIPLCGSRGWSEAETPRPGDHMPLLGSVANLPVALWEHRIERVVIDLEHHARERPHAGQDPADQVGGREGEPAAAPTRWWAGRWRSTTWRASRS